MIWAMIFLTLVGWFALLAWLVKYVETWDSYFSYSGR